MSQHLPFMKCGGCSHQFGKIAAMKCPKCEKNHSNWQFPYVESVSAENKSLRKAAAEAKAAQAEMSANRDIAIADASKANAAAQAAQAALTAEMLTRRGLEEELESLKGKSGMPKTAISDAMAENRKLREALDQATARAAAAEQSLADEKRRAAVNAEAASELAALRPKYAQAAVDLDALRGALSAAIASGAGAAAPVVMAAPVQNSSGADAEVARLKEQISRLERELATARQDGATARAAASAAEGKARAEASRASILERELAQLQCNQRQPRSTPAPIQMPAQECSEGGGYVCVSPAGAKRSPGMRIGGGIANAVDYVFHRPKK